MNITSKSGSYVSFWILFLSKNGSYISFWWKRILRQRVVLLFHHSVKKEYLDIWWLVNLPSSQRGVILLHYEFLVNFMVNLCSEFLRRKSTPQYILKIDSQAKSGDSASLWCKRLSGESLVNLSAGLPQYIFKIDQQNGLASHEDTLG